MIPKIIHYCWFGGNEFPAVAVECMKSWRKFLPEWEIKEWNESNFDISSSQYVQDAYRLKKWAFISDVVRMKALYEQGGVYLDIDVEFIKPLPEEFLSYKGLMGFEHTKTVAPGLIFGVEKGNRFVKEIYDSYAEERFFYKKNGIYRTINTRITEKLIEDGLKKNNELQVIDGFHIYPSEYFCGYNTDIREPEITENTICWHHYLGSWSNPSMKMRMQDQLKKLIGVKNYKKVITFVRKVRK